MQYRRITAGEMAVSPQQFCLRWNNHQSNIISVFEQLLQSEAFVDVTLAVEGMSLKAHKVVLSACSPYFQAVLGSHPDKHPIVILKDVRYGDMRDLLDFMYRGEVSVDQENLSGFLKVAESLRIKGLTEVNEKKRMESSTSPYLFQHGTTLASSVPTISTIGDVTTLKRPPSSPIIQYSTNKRRRGRPPKISGEESEGETNHASSGANSTISAIDSEESKTDSDIKNIKIEAEELTEIFNEEVKNNEARVTESAGPSGEIIVKDEPKFQKEECDTRESPGSDVCCIPDIWMREGKVVRTASVTTIASTISNLSLVSPETPSTPSTPIACIKIERITPSSTPTTTSCCTPNSTPHLLGQTILPPIFVPIQSAPLDLHITDSCDSNNTDSEHTNITLDYVLNSNGTATCKLCGELLPSRNHWYRHKYKTHASALYRCDECGVVYKSKKGFETHMEVKHAKVKPVTPERPKRWNWEGSTRGVEDAKRQQEEAMVKAIIARVKMECAMEGKNKSF